MAEFCLVSAKFSSVRAEFSSVRAEFSSVRAQNSSVKAELNSERAGFCKVRTKFRSVRAELSSVSLTISRYRYRILLREKRVKFSQDRAELPKQSFCFCKYIRTVRQGRRLTGGRYGDDPDSCSGLPATHQVEREERTLKKIALHQHLK